MEPNENRSKYKQEVDQEENIAVETTYPQSDPNLVETLLNRTSAAALRHSYRQADTTAPDNSKKKTRERSDGDKETHDLDREKEDQNQMRQNLDRMKQELDSEEQDLYQADRDVDRMKQELEHMKQDQEQEKQDLATKKQDLAREKQDLAKEKQDLATEKQDLAREKQDLATEKQDLAREKQDLAAEKQDLATEKQDLATEKQDLATEKQDLATEKQDLAAGKQDLATEKQDLAAGKKNLIRTRQKVDQDKQDVNREKQNLATEKQNLATEKKSLDKMRQNVDQEKQELCRIKQAAAREESNPEKGEDNEDQRALKGVLCNLRRVLQPDEYKTAEAVVNDYCRGILQCENATNLLTVLKDYAKPRQPVKKGLSQLRHQIKSAAVQIFCVITGETFGAHQKLLDQVKNLKGFSVVESPQWQDCQVLILFTSNAEVAMRNIPDGKPVILVLMHHTRDINFPTLGRKWSDSFENIVLDVHVLYHQTRQGLLTCPKNQQAVSHIQEVLQRYTKKHT
ncbi:uncharacterized protein LOC142988941 [Genypterus blacodes]|uniref:uncharacterized protein LOC142988941 n=1 Tax=Genypterus blacodes TaxID=154954 RepID=UPI003F76FB13